MFAKYASNILENLSNECLLKSFACKDEDLSLIYSNLSNKINQLIGRICVESTNASLSKKNG